VSRGDLRFHPIAGFSIVVSDDLEDWDRESALPTLVAIERDEAIPLDATTTLGEIAGGEEAARLSYDPADVAWVCATLERVHAIDESAVRAFEANGIMDRIRGELLEIVGVSKPNVQVGCGVEGDVRAAAPRVASDG
jgi:hypothetical protein